MAKFIDLNADMGESYGRWKLGVDEEIMPYLSSANVACGFHGGDPHVMRKSVALALRHGRAEQAVELFAGTGDGFHFERSCIDRADGVVPRVRDVEGAGIRRE